jgi:hypothetical protein
MDSNPRSPVRDHPFRDQYTRHNRSRPADVCVARGLRQRGQTARAEGRSPASRRATNCAHDHRRGGLNHTPMSCPWRQTDDRAQSSEDSPVFRSFLRRSIFFKIFCLSAFTSTLSGSPTCSLWRSTTLSTQPMRVRKKKKKSRATRGRAGCRSPRCRPAMPSQKYWQR